MAGLKLKICGMREPGNILEVERMGPDYLGFIFYSRSPRYVGETFEIPAVLGKNVKRVGVFVNEAPDKVLRTAKAHSLDVVQLHGGETAYDCEKLRGEGIQVMKVFSVGDGFDFRQVDPFRESVDYYLFDTKGKNYGGNAEAFDWKQLQDYDQSVPFFLSGGISASNINGVLALKDMNLFGIDINSGVESSPGNKDVNLVKEFIEEFKRIDYELSR